MRVAAILLVLLSIAGASVGAATPRQAGLRGPVSTDGTAGPAPTAVAAAAKPRKAAATPLASPAPADDGQCRRTCAHSYYRCLAGDYAEQCPQAWTLCHADCERAAAGLR